MPRRSLLPGILLTVALACGKEGGDTTTGASEGSSSGTATTGGSSGSSGTPTTGGMTTVTTVTTGETMTTGNAMTTGDATTGESSTTGSEDSGFERFTLNRAAGPCPPDADCDGVIEVLASGILRVEPFGAVGDPLTEVALSAEDFAAARLVFTDLALLALLDGPDPVCDPPTDVFESMIVVIDTMPHDATTTFCDQPPIAAARDMANALSEKYVP